MRMTLSSRLTVDWISAFILVEVNLRLKFQYCLYCLYIVLDTAVLAQDFAISVPCLYFVILAYFYKAFTGISALNFYFTHSAFYTVILPLNGLHYPRLNIWQRYFKLESHELEACANF